jgi:hypothetical protein
MFNVRYCDYNIEDVIYYESVLEGVILARRYNQRNFAVKGINGVIYWYNMYGECDRPDGPAVIYSNGDKKWFINGKRHRADGPAIELFNGDKYWFYNGVRHRLDGPAIMFEMTGELCWYIEGKEYTEYEFNKYINESYICDVSVISRKIPDYKFNLR